MAPVSLQVIHVAIFTALCCVNVETATVSSSKPLMRRDSRQVVPDGSDIATPRSHKVLYVVWTTREFYETRVRWALTTWAKKLDWDVELVVIGDERGPKLHTTAGHFDINQTRCAAQNFGLGQCCKTGEAVVAAQQYMRKYPSLEWAFFADDDVFIETTALEAALLRQSPPKSTNGGVVIANSFGCFTPKCEHNLCGGGGFAANRRAIEAMVGDDPRGFAEEQVHRCQECATSPKSSDVYHDVALGEIFKNRKIEERLLYGLYPWRLDKQCFDASLVSKDPPLLYHTIRNKAQFEMLDRLFHTPAKLNSKTANSQTCAIFRGNVICTSGIEEDMPWTLHKVNDSTCMVSEIDRNIQKDRIKQEHIAEEGRRIMENRILRFKIEQETRHRWQLLIVVLPAWMFVIAAMWQRSTHHKHGNFEQAVQEDPKQSLPKNMLALFNHVSDEH